MVQWIQIQDGLKKFKMKFKKLAKISCFEERMFFLESLRRLLEL